jgi:hypothetical protein
MQVAVLQNALSPFNLLVNASALSANYRVLAIAPDRVRGCSMFGAMEVAIETGLTSEICVDGESFLQVLRSLPSGDFQMVVSGDILSWSCGSAKGRLGTRSEGQVGQLEFPEDIQFREVGASFGHGLEIGSLGCGSSGLMSLGLYGISIVYSGGHFRACSTDNSLIADAYLCADDLPAATLSPEGVKLLAALTSVNRADIAIDDQSVYCRTATCRLLLKQKSPLKYAIHDRVRMFYGEDIKIGLKRDVVTAFIRRSEALTEVKNRTNVSISVVDGAVRLSFEDGKSSSEEYYLAEGGGLISVDPISIDTRRLARALGHVTDIVFDYVEQGALVLRGDKFVFVIAGKSPAAD